MEVETAWALGYLNIILIYNYIGYALLKAYWEISKYSKIDTIKKTILIILDIIIIISISYIVFLLIYSDQWAFSDLWNLPTIYKLSDIEFVRDMGFRTALSILTFILSILYGFSSWALKITKLNVNIIIKAMIIPIVLVTLPLFFPLWILYAYVDIFLNIQEYIVRRMGLTIAVSVSPSLGQKESIPKPHPAVKKIKTSSLGHKEVIQRQQHAFKKFKTSFERKELIQKQQPSFKKVKNPLLAMLLSFLIVGSGQIYNGQIKKGFTLMSITYIGTIFLIILFVALSDWGWGITSILVLFIAVFTPLSCWFYSIYDAYDTSFHLNENMVIRDWFSNIGNRRVLLGMICSIVIIILTTYFLYYSCSLGWKDKGESLFAQGRYEEAIQAYDKAIEMDPLSPDALNGKGDAFQKLGKYEEAIEAYDKTIEMDQSYVEDSLYVHALNSKGDALSKLGRDEEASMCYEKADELSEQEF